MKNIEKLECLNYNEELVLNKNHYSCVKCGYVNRW